jgi:hypothetical protein
MIHKFKLICQRVLPLIRRQLRQIFGIFGGVAARS